MRRELYFLQPILVTQQDAKLTVRDSPQAIDIGCVSLLPKLHSIHLYHFFR